MCSVLAKTYNTLHYHLVESDMARDNQSTDQRKEWEKASSDTLPQGRMEDSDHVFGWN